MSRDLIERLQSYYVVHGGEPLFRSDKKVHKAADLHEAVEEIVRLRHEVALAREGYHTAYAEFDAKCAVVNRQAAEIRDLRAELSSLRGEGEQDFGAMKAAAKIILRDYQLGNLTKIGVANRLRGAGFTLEYACKMAHGLPDHPTPDSDVIGRLVEIVNDTQSTLSAVKAEATVDGGGTCIWIAETLHAQMLTNAAALASIPSTEGSASLNGGASAAPR